MGVRIENYSLNELHRIAVPGTVTPSLFWVLPVGNWRPRQLDEIWRWFTERPSECRDYGLLLVKDRGRTIPEGTDVSLESVGAKLSDVMPVGTRSFVGPSAFREEGPKVLVLSGGYPQPGWGVLVEWQEEPFAFERLIRETNTRLSSEQRFADTLGVFAEAARTFHSWQNLRREPAQSDFSSGEAEMIGVEKAIGILSEVQMALQSKQYRLVGEKLVEGFQKVQKIPWLNLSDSDVTSLLDAQKSITTAASILAIPQEVLLSEIEPKLTFLITDPSKRNAAFKSLRTTELKDALSACLRLREKQLVGEGGDFRAWAQRDLVDAPLALSNDLEEVLRNLAIQLKGHRGEHAQLVRDRELAVNDRRRRSGEARNSFHRAAEKATELQWHLGPHFLVAFEDICREDRLWVRSIPWDPARMVGWKIMARGVSLEFKDLAIAARELSPGIATDISGNGESSAQADGSYFTDYVHHIAMSRPGVSPRTVTCDLVARLVRPAEMISLLGKHEGQRQDEVGAQDLAETLIESFGWRSCDEVPETPLAGCIGATADGAVAITPQMSDKDLRIVLESFCKDLLDVIVAKLGYTQREVWAAIAETLPEYRPLSKEKNWDEEVRKMTCGGAAMLLPALGSLAFRALETEVTACAAALVKLSEILNQGSHHRPGQPSRDPDHTRIPALVREVLQKAQEFLGELPWHLKPTFIYGEQPKVMSGEAWSHGSATPRLLRVIVWDGTAPGSQVMFWNKTRRNPIVTDPVFVVRPQ
jgi:hypothetical protein